ncbi:putative linoleate 9S-lipoxygenase 5 [Glycine max]|nr:putative linoleate 9S-lipoxygenase 5 [Glycine max]
MGRLTGVAVEDSTSPYGLRLLIEDYPFAVDGLEIWFAIKTWVKDYCSFYYKEDDTIKKDTELQSWWKEIREVGHGDKKDEPWWPKMQTCEELIQTCTIIIWIASALHAAINFVQYPYGGFPPSRPQKKELQITSQFLAVLGISLVEILSKHSSDEVSLGQRDTPDWTSDAEPLQAFEKFGKKLADIEERILRMNSDEKFRNRYGPVKMPYTLLYPTSKGGLTGMGFPTLEMITGVTFDLSQNFDRLKEQSGISTRLNFPFQDGVSLQGKKGPRIEVIEDFVLKLIKGSKISSIN